MNELNLCVLTLNEVAQWLHSLLCGVRFSFVIIHCHYVVFSVNDIDLCRPAVTRFLKGGGLALGA